MRPRKANKHLPRRMYQRHGAFYFVHADGKWERLAEDYPSALRRYAAVVDRPVSLSTIALMMARYENDVLPRQAPKTAKGRKAQFGKLRPVFGHMRPEDVTAADAWQYFEDRGQIEQAKKEVSGLSALLSMGVKWGALKANPLLKVRFPSGGPRRRYVTDEEFLAVRALAPPMVQAAMDIAYITGMRQTDILKLERRNLTPEGIVLRQSKTDVGQLHEWSDELKRVVDDVLALRPQLRRFVIANRRGKGYTENGFQSQWQRVQRKCPVRFQFRDLRAKNISDDEDLQRASKRAGHTDLRITQKVYRRLPERVSPLSFGQKAGVLDK